MAETSSSTTFRKATGSPTTRTNLREETSFLASNLDSTVVLRSKMSANKDLEKYLETTVGASRSETAATAVRNLAEAVCSDPTCADAWWALLHHEECYFERSGASRGEYVKRSSTADVILFDLYDWATRLVPQKTNKTKPAFVNIWLGHARQQWLRGQDDALDAIKALKTQQIGLSFAPMYLEWASIEAASGRLQKALSVVAKGIRERAAPIGHLEELERALKAGTFEYRPFWQFSVDESAPLAVDQPVGVPSSSSALTGMVGKSALLALESKTPGFVRESLNSLSERRSSCGGSSGSGSSEEDATTGNMTLGGVVGVESIGGVGSVGAKLHAATNGKSVSNSKLVTPVSASSLSARRSRITYNKVTGSCEKVAKSLREDLTLHRPPTLHAIPENTSADGETTAARAPDERKALVIEGGEDTACLDGETLPISGSMNRDTVPSSSSLGGVAGGGGEFGTVGTVGVASVVPQRTPIPNKAAAAAGTMPAPTVPAARAPPHPPPSHTANTTNTNSTTNTANRKIVENEQMVIVRGIQYTKLECVGKGGSSKVYKVMAPNKKIFALKRIRLNGRDEEAATGFLDEITLLARLKGKSNIIQLIDSEVHKRDGIIYMVLECGDIDLAKLLQRHEAALQERRRAVPSAAASSGPGGPTYPTQSTDQNKVHVVDENFVRMYWEQMLHAVDTIHRERIVHSDLKPANFLVVEGQLKLIDFGIAKAIQADTTSIARESQVGTLNYMSPEAITGGSPATPTGGPATKVGRASDIWSLGCILYQMVYGKTPFAHLPFIQKMHAIIDDNHAIGFPPIANPCLMDVIKRCLCRQPKGRITMEELLDHPFLHPEREHARISRDADPTNSNIELSKEQLRTLLQKVATSGADADFNILSDQLFLQLAGVADKENRGETRETRGVCEPGGSERTVPGRQPLGDHGNPQYHDRHDRHDRHL